MAPRGGPSYRGATLLLLLVCGASSSCMLVMDTDFDRTGHDAGVAGSGGSAGHPACEAPVSGTCDTIPQCGCPADQACDVYSSTGATSCFTTANIALGHACPARELGECSPGLTCVATTCKAFCSTESDCLMPDAMCFQVKFSDGDTDVPIPEMRVCTDQCDLTAPQGQCGPDATCFPFSELGASPGQSICALTGGTSTGGCAEDALSCAPGFSCMADGRCHRWCQLSGADCGGEACVPVTNAEGSATGHFVGALEFGVCP